MSSDFGPGDVGEALAQAADDAVGLVDRERGLGEVGHAVRVLDLECVHVVLGLDQHEVLGRLAHRALHLLVARRGRSGRSCSPRRRTSWPPRAPWSRAGRWRRSSCSRARLGVLRAPTGPRRGPRRRRSRRPAPRSPPRRRSRRARAAARPRACCARSPCARTREGRRARARARRSGRPGRRPRSTRAAPPAAVFAGLRPPCRRLARPSETRAAARTPSRPPRRRCAPRPHVEVVAGAVPAGEVEVDQVDGRHAPPRGTGCGRRGSRPGCRRGTPGRAHAASGRTQLSPQPLVRVRLARDAQAALADEVEQDHGARVVEAARGHLGCRAARAARSRRPARRAGSPRRRRR